MSIRYVSQDLAWSESMKKAVRSRIFEPMARRIRDYEISVHLDIGWKKHPEIVPQYELWVVMQSFDGRQNSIVRRRGSSLNEVAEGVARQVRDMLPPERMRFFNFF